MSNIHDDIDLNNRLIVTVIGSTQFQKEIMQWAFNVTKQGNLVLFAPFAKEENPEVKQIREELEAQHYQKIRMADIVFVFNKNRYIGKSTQQELEYAQKIGKIIAFLEE
jgi:excinuclease UvrABC ATPase subunit